jgi:hypothetical protein
MPYQYVRELLTADQARLRGSSLTEGKVFGLTDLK